MKSVPTFKKLIHELNQLPGVGIRGAERLAYFILCSPKEYVNQLCSSLEKVKENIKECQCCFSYTEEDLCCYCRDPFREQSVICVVENPSDLWRIENSGVFRGLYHVLHGLISPLHKKEANDLTISFLLSRIQNHSLGVKEIILAFNSDIEGDTTALYITEQLQGKDIKITRLAQGVPIGGHIDHTDQRTLGKAIENRVKM